MYDSIECIEPNNAISLVVEVFKTNVRYKRVAKMIIADLNQLLPNAKINFDLQDCDNILRIESQQVNVYNVIAIVRGAGFECELLE